MAKPAGGLPCPVFTVDDNMVMLVNPIVYGLMTLHPLYRLYEIETPRVLPLHTKRLMQLLLHTPYRYEHIFPCELPLRATPQLLAWNLGHFGHVTVRPSMPGLTLVTQESR
jgi:hypothetical protein